MADDRQSIIITGVSGNLGQRLLPLLDDFKVVGVDLRPPENASLARFESMDFGSESCVRKLISLINDSSACAVVHLAFVLDPVRTGVLDVDRMWQINVAGTTRVTEAIAVANRYGAAVTRFIFPSSVSAYGPETPGPVKEDHALGAHTLPYAIHKMEADRVVQSRYESLGHFTTTYMLRPHIFTGASMQNYMVGALRGTPLGKSKRAEKMRAKGTRLPLMLPFGDRYLNNKLQFVHVDDMARLLAWLLRRSPEGNRLHILNVAGRCGSVTIPECARVAHAKIIRLPKPACEFLLRKLWGWEISSIPPEALPYMIGSYTMDTTRLQEMLGADYAKVIQYTVRDALADSFRTTEDNRQASEQPTVATGV
jgi:nucleoside-diphosphate-sugar epimerase